MFSNVSIIEMFRDQPVFYLSFNTLKQTLNKNLKKKLKHLLVERELRANLD